MTDMYDIERKYLINEIPKFENKQKGVIIRTGFITKDKGSETRIKQVGNKLMMTIYSPIANAKNIIEIALNKKQFDELWKHTKGHRIRRRRFYYKEKKQVFSIDIFQGKHKGLILACTSFDNETLAIHFKPPAWLGMDVTSDENYNIKNLVFSKEEDLNI